MAVSSEDNRIPRRKRINCSNCGYRVPADALLCPHCRADPRQWRLRWSTALLLLLGALLFIYLCVLTIRILPALIGSVSIPEPTATASPTRTPTITIVVQAMELTATPSPITLPPTLPPSATPTTTSRFTLTPTRRGAPTGTPTLGSPTPKLADYAAPKLTAPLNMAMFSGSDANIALEWQSVSTSGLRENEWYQVSASYTARTGAITQTVWSRETRYQVKKEWWNDALPSARIFSWNIQVMRVEGADPYASPSRVPASPPSETFKFEWK